MKTQIDNFGLKDIFLNTSLAGWVLLARPVIYYIFSRKRDLSAYASVDFSALIFIIYAAISCFIGVKAINITYSDFGKLIVKKSPISIFILYSILGLISMMWSVSPALTGFRAFECFAMTVLIVAVIQNLFEYRNLKFVILWSLLYCTWDAIWAIFRTAKWSINIDSLLESSQMMSSTFFFMALYFIPRKWYNYFIMIMSLFSMSTVAYLGMALGTISAFWKQGKSKVLAYFVGFIILIAIVGVGPYAFFKDTIFFDKQNISLEETSGRNHLLEATIDCIEKHPFGLGFFAAEPYVIYSRGLGAISAHNSLFSAGMGMGWPGIILLACFLGAMFKVTFSQFLSSEYKPMMIGCMLVAFMQCMGNPSVGTRVFAAWMPCMYVFVLICGFYVYGKYQYGNNEYNEYENNLDYEELS